MTKEYQKSLLQNPSGLTIISPRQVQKLNGDEQLTSIENIEFFDEDALYDRLTDGLQCDKKEVVFVVGSPLTAPEEQDRPGVSTVSQMVSHIREQFPEDSPVRSKFESNIASSPNQYQAAFHFLQGRRGQDACNQLVRRAVLKARQRTNGFDPSKFDARALTNDQLRELDESEDGWYLSRGAESLGKIITLNPELFGKTLITSNFDPLVEVSVRRAQGQVWKTLLTADTDLSTTEASGCRVIHIHGYWHGTDTLHTGTQLIQSRPTLKSSLLEILKDKLVVVVAYGGWDDILTSALKELTGNTSVFPEVLWTFFDTTPVIGEHLRSVLQPGLDRGRTTLYAGINCHEIFSKLQKYWEGSPLNSNSETQTPMRYSSTPKTLKRLECDRPPTIDVWVGREAELRSLETTTAPVVILSGIGGQGKSLTAAKHIKDTFNNSARFHFWDWRDCKEAGDSIRTQVAAAIERISSEETTSDMLADATDVDLANILAEYGRSIKTLFVFDNVDHYVDLEHFKFVGLMEKLVQQFSDTVTSSSLLITCRPNVSYADPKIVTIPMPGLSKDETCALFEKRGVHEGNSDINNAHEMTKGHPFWLDLIAVQVAEVPGVTLKGFLEDLRRGREESPDILSSIWSGLAEREQILLRTMAETVRPETKQTIEAYVSTKLRYAKFDKALRSLIRLNLVVVKPELDSPDLYDLHPLVRTFVKYSFSRLERLDFIHIIINQYHVIVKRIEKLLGAELPLPMLMRWTQKAELEIAAGNYVDSAETLEISRVALVGGGHSEEFIRVTRLFLEAVDWNTAPSEIKEFDKIVGEFVGCLDDIGDSQGADQILSRLEKTISEKTARYIHYADMRCYAFWKRGEFESAIEWGIIGKELKFKSNVDTVYGCDHNLALSKRDSGDYTGALEYFINGEPLESFLDPASKVSIDNGPQQGNIGRCLQLMGNTEGALVCYKKSIKALEYCNDSGRLSNFAYARMWIAEVLYEKKEYQTALAFAMSAEAILARISPSRAQRAGDLKQKISSAIPTTTRNFDVLWADRQVRKWTQSA